MKTQLERMIEQLARGRDDARRAEPGAGSDGEARRFVEAGRARAARALDPDALDWAALLAGADPIRPAAPDLPAARPTAWVWGLAAASVAAAVLVGVFLGRRVAPPPPTGELARVDAWPAYGIDRAGPPPEPVTRDGRGTYAILRPSFEVVIDSSQKGFATLVLLSPRSHRVYPGPREQDVTVGPGQRCVYRPLNRPEEKSTLLVVVTAAPAAETIRAALGDTPAGADAVEQRVDLVRQALRTSHPEAVIHPMSLAPAADKK